VNNKLGKSKVLFIKIS